MIELHKVKDIYGKKWLQGKHKGIRFKVTQELLDDPLFDLEGYVNGQLALNKLNLLVDNFNKRGGGGCEVT